MNWKPLNSIDELPRGIVQFLIWSNGGGAEVVFVSRNNNIKNFDTGKIVNIENYSHWCEIVGPDEKNTDFILNDIQKAQEHWFGKIKEIVTVKFK